MYAYTKKLHRLTILALVVFTMTVFAAAVQAQGAAQMAHNLLRQRILHDAGDRYNVRFFTTHVDRSAGRLRVVTGTGIFRRRGKNPQRFTYHITVNPRTRNVRDLGYNIQ